MGDEHHREPEVFLQLLEQREHLRLHHDVERGGGLVRDEEVRDCTRAPSRSSRAGVGRLRAGVGRRRPGARGDRPARAAHRRVPGSPCRRSGRAAGWPRRSGASPSRPGSSACIAPWNTMAASVQRTARRRPGLMVKTFSPSRSTSPSTFVPCGSSLSTAAARLDFPQPDSPASPSVSPGMQREAHPADRGDVAVAARIRHVQIADVEQRLVLDDRQTRSTRHPRRALIAASGWG